MRMATIGALLLLVFSFLLQACGDDDDNDTMADDDDVTDDDAADDDAADDDAVDDDVADDDNDDTGAGDAWKSFPVGMAVASPLHFMEGEEKAAWTSDFSWYTARIEEILNGTLPLLSAFDPENFYLLPADAPCYGPALPFENHPDGALPNSGELPTGDLGIWLEVDDVSLGGSGDACAAAELNTRLSGMSEQSFAALAVLAGLLRAAIDNGYPPPANAGDSLTLIAEMNALGIPDVTFNDAKISCPGDGEWEYVVDFTYLRDGASENVNVTLDHVSGGSADMYEGRIFYTATWEMGVGTDGNCPDTYHTINGSLVYQRDGETSMDIQSRFANFCGNGSGAPDANGQVDADDTCDEVTTGGWSQSFNIFVANFDPTTVAGDYAYAWQAGPGDANSRVLNVGLNNHTPLDGESYFGYGDPITDTDGSIQGLICNWTAPGTSLTMHDYAQRQFLEFDTTTGLFTQPVGGSDILYAPTNSCEYDGSGTFWYDRNLNGAQDETAADLIVSPVDLLTPATGQTVPEAIAARGYDLPTAPGDWPVAY